MATEEQKVALIVQSHDLSSLELGHGWEECLEHAADGMTQTGDKVVKNELWIVIGGVCMSLEKRRSEGSMRFSTFDYERGFPSRVGWRLT